jgi:antirestriction protein
LGSRRHALADTPRIYVACLASYNRGVLHGRWVDCVHAEEVQDAIAAMLKESPEPGSQEWAIHDAEGWGSYRVDEHEDLDILAPMGSAIAEHGELLAAFLGHISEPQDADAVAQAVERYELSYQGTFRSLEDWAEGFLEDTGALRDCPESLRPYIDYEAWASDAVFNGEVFTVDTPNGEVAVFWGNE